MTYDERWIRTALIGLALTAVMAIIIALGNGLDYLVNLLR